MVLRFIHLAPKLLNKQFHKEKYYKHMCELGNIMKIMLQFCITLKEVEDIGERLISWVKRYERYANLHSANMQSIMTKPRFNSDIITSTMQSACLLAR